ncbi:MAG TPA: hypothetical protein VI958_00160, partial [Acidobacteriota bacterium]
MTFLTRFFGIFPGEVKRTAILSSYLFLLVAGFIMAKSVRDGLFLTQSSPLNLPYLYIAIAVLTGLAITAYSRISRRFRLDNAIAGMQAFIALTLF